MVAAALMMADRKGKGMEEKIKALEKELEKVCGTYEKDCSKCPKQAECEEYCKLYQIYEGR